MKILSPAKINLRLEILHKREDGYHEIRGIFQKINLADEIAVSLKHDKGITLSCSDPELPQGEDNLAFKAALLFLSQTRKKAGVRIRIDKKIPLASGLGGGSSNAASVLIALNKMMKLHLASELMMEMGKKLGADVPFFLFPQKTALAAGIGEKLETIFLKPRFYLVLVNPGIPVSSTFAYQRVKRELTKRTKDTINIPTKIEGLPDLIPLLFNDFEEVIFPLYPEIKEIKERLVIEGAEGSLMSGSGSTVFGIFGCRRDALRVYQRLKSETDWKVFFTRCM
jgi:4-diphosphocytidyl-2-C-methyl-D-erythritol kinase